MKVDRSACIHAVDSVAYLGNGQHQHGDNKGHEGCPKVKENEPGSSIQQENVSKVQEEEEFIWLQKSHFLHRGTQFTEVFYQHFLWEARVLEISWSQSIALQPQKTTPLVLRLSSLWQVTGFIQEMSKIVLSSGCYRFTITRAQHYSDIVRK